MTQSYPRTGDGDAVRGAIRILQRGWIVIVAAGLLFGLAALGYSLLQKPVYQAVATLYVTSGTGDSSQSALQGNMASQQRVSSYTKLVNTGAVVDEAIKSGNLAITASQARSSLSATTTPDTVLLNIIAQNTSRETAQGLANATAEAMTSYVATLETPSGGGEPLAKLTVVTPASASSDAVSPRTARNVVLAAVLGLILGVCVVLVRGRLSNRVRDEGELADVSAAPVLAAVPSDDLLREQGLIDFSSGATLAAEAYRKLRTNLAFTTVDSPSRIIIVTSALAAEGKTTTAMNLAAALAETGKRVVLVDADLRRPQVYHRTGGMGDVGFTNYLKGDGSLADLLQPSEVSGLQILASGPQPPNPAELLGSKKAGQGISNLSEMFDYVIIDSPPLLPVTDAAVLAQWADGVVLVARANQSRIPDVSAAIEQLEAVQATLVGVVLTDVPTRGGAYKYGYYYTSSDVMKKPGFFSRFGKKNSHQHQNIETAIEPASNIEVR
ncbi:polysaccharide biosynthesis tyrosine autokinase [Gordonia rubripertincta]|uniref:Polysaccharide biosynthesis tyrosine autokinase n=1 Tax=Gordonia rubripertincta TaxID=36822 RepID=A0ABT4N005_GORRU|nr:polysaccharide biosynthesis tyrosine autokinase [Gordonia rubripertincta]MCZ4551791.1 polysaccharide biosynthesis tyrosine autokinase [Gordonia rubripertincta]